MVVNVRARLLSDGEYQALDVNVIRTEQEFTTDGQITVYPHSLTFSILGSDGQTNTFLVKAKTLFSGHGVSSANQLRPGMQVRVTYLITSNGKLRALDVIVINKK
jgi:hypothetical protein